MTAATAPSPLALLQHELQDAILREIDAFRAAFAAAYPRAHATDALSPVAVVLTAAMHATCRALTAREGTDLDLMAALTHPITLNALALHARVFDAAGKDAAPKDAAR